MRMETSFARPADLEGMMKLAAQADFPGLQMDQHRAAVISCIARGEAICAREGENVIGALLFSREDGELCFLAVDASHRRRHVARGLVEFLGGHTTGDITVTTYRADDPRGAAAQAFYRKMGFEPGRLTQAYGYPVQEFIWRREG